jgi:hypothetical protein
MLDLHRMLMRYTSAVRRFELFSINDPMTSWIRSSLSLQARLNIADDDKPDRDYECG